MDFLSMFIFSFLLLSFTVWLAGYVQRSLIYPPGPCGIPVLGFLPWITDKPHEKFCELAEMYGGVFSVKLGSIKAVVLNDWPSIRKTLVEKPEVFIGRPKQYLLDALSKRNDIVFSDGYVWRKQRKLIIQSLRKVQNDTKGMESRNMDMVNAMLDDFGKNDGLILPMNSFLFGHIHKNIWKMITDIDMGEEKMREFENTHTKLIEILTINNPLNYLPWLRFVPPNGFGYWETIRLNEKLLSFIKDVIDKHMGNWNKDSQHNIVDFYLDEINAHEKLDLFPEPPYIVENLKMSLWNLIIAGTDTTNSTCLWGLLHLACNPEVQQKAQAEMDEVVGSNRLPTLDDFPLLPYVEAMILEIHRVSSVVPLSILHENLRIAQISRYIVPKGTTVIQNIYAVHNDPSLWDRPEIFQPDRFISVHNTVTVPPYLMPYSVGTRMCVGQAVAEMSLKLIFSCLLHRFSFSLPPDMPIPSMEPKMGLQMKPYPYSLLVQMRKTETPLS